MNSRLPRYDDGSAPSWYQPGGAIGQGFSRLGSFAKRQLEMQGQQQLAESQRAVDQGQAVGDFIGSGVRAGVDLGYQDTRDWLRESIARQRLLKDDPSQATWMDNPFNPLVGVQSGLRANELYSNFVPPSAYESARSVPYVGQTLENTIRFAASPLGIASAATAPLLSLQSVAGGALAEGGAKLAGLSDEAQGIASDIGMAVGPASGSAIRLGKRGLGIADKALSGALGLDDAAIRATAGPVESMAPGAFKPASPRPAGRMGMEPGEPTVTLYRGDAGTTGPLSLAKMQLGGRLGRGIYTTNNESLFDQSPGYITPNLGRLYKSAANVPDPNMRIPRSAAGTPEKALALYRREGVRAEIAERLENSNRYLIKNKFVPLSVGNTPEEVAKNYPVYASGGVESATETVYAANQWAAVNRYPLPYPSPKQAIEDLVFFKAKEKSSQLGELEVRASNAGGWYVSQAPKTLSKELVAEIQKDWNNTRIPIEAVIDPATDSWKFSMGGYKGKGGQLTEFQVPQSVMDRVIDASAPLSKDVLANIPISQRKNFSVVSNPTYTVPYNELLERIRNSGLSAEKAQTMLRRAMRKAGYVGVQGPMGMAGAGGVEAGVKEIIFWDEQTIQKLQKGEKLGPRTPAYNPSPGAMERTYPRRADGTDSDIGGYPRYDEGTIDPVVADIIRQMMSGENVGGGSDIKTRVPNRTKGVSRLPLRNQVQEPIVQQPQPRSLGGSVASGLGNILSVATTPLLTVPKTGNALIDFLGSGVEGLTSPLGLGFTALAPFTGGASLGLSGVAGQAARIGTRVGAEALVGATAGLASQKAQELLPEDTSPLIRGGVGLGAGLLAGTAGVKAFQRVPAFAPPKKAAAFGVKVARDVELEPGGSKFITDPVTNQPTVDYSQIPSQPTGAPVRGVPIAPDSVPNMLYAVVGNRQKVIDTGRLRTGPVTGSAGSALDEVVTLFDNRDTADQLASDFKTIASAFKNPKADVISDLQASAGRDGWQWAGIFTKANTTEEILTDYFTSRSASKAVNPSLAVNPLEFASISEVRAFKPNEIGTVFVSKGSLQGVPDAATGTASGAMLTSDQTGSTPNLNLYGDVRLATGAQIQAVEADPAIRQFILALEDARVYAESNVGWEGLKKVRSAENTERVGKSKAAMARAMAAGKSTEEIERVGANALRGRMATLELPPQFALDPAWLPAIKAKIQEGQVAPNAPFTFYEGLHAKEALDSLFIENIFPNKSQMVDLQKVLGLQFTTALEAFKNPTARDKLFDILNIPRAVLASADVSYPARQGLLLALADPITGAKMAMNAVRAYVSPKFAEEVNSLASGLTGTPLQQAKSNALLRWGMDVLGEGSSAEEQFRMGLVGKRMFGSNEAGRIMRASDRSYSTAGNYQRWTTGQKYLDDMIAIHLKPGEDVNDIKIVTDILAKRISETDGEQLAKTLNILTGRTSWKKLTQGDLGQILNAGFFSPGFFASRIQAPFLLPARLVEYAKSDPSKLLNPVNLYMSDPILKLQANMFGGMIAQGLGVYGMIQLAHAAGAPDVDMQLNPLKADFGKLKVGETRYDFWGGYTPMVRLVAQELTGKRIGPRGEEYEANRAELMSQFMRSKVSPTAGFGWDVATGQNFTGQRVSFERNSIEEQTISAITPLFLQDIISGFKEGGTAGGIKALPSIFGAGVQSFTSINALKDSIASEITGGKKTNYKDLTGAERSVADQDQRLVMKIIEQQQGIPANSFADAMRILLEERQNEERLYMWRGAQGMDTRKKISDNMAELQQKTTAKREQALKDFQVPGAAEPTSALQEGLALWRNLYNLSDLGADQNIKTGKIDWDTFESLQQELFKSLTPEQTAFIEERSRYSSTEEAKWWFNNRDYVNSTEYYKIPTQVFGKFSERVSRIDGEIQSYGDLITSVDYFKYSNPNKYRVLNSILTSIKKDVTAQRKTMRTRNPELDVALYQLGRANTVLTPKAKNMMGGAEAWVDSNTGQPD